MLPSGLNYTNETHISDPKIFTSLNNFPFLPDLHGREKLNAWVFFPCEIRTSWDMLNSDAQLSFNYQFHFCMQRDYIYIYVQNICVYF